MFSASISWQYKSRHIFKSFVKYLKHLEKVCPWITGASSVTRVLLGMPLNFPVIQNWGIKCEFLLLLFISLSSVGDLEN